VHREILTPSKKYTRHSFERLHVEGEIA
jgi:hypothetical protein